MTAPITPADRRAAHAAFVNAIRSGAGNVQRCQGDDATCEHTLVCDAVAQTIADVRDGENRACERGVALMVTAAGAEGKVSQTIALGEARLAIAARRGAP